MQKDEGNSIQPDLVDLNEVMQAFGVEKWVNLGPVLAVHGEQL